MGKLSIYPPTGETRPRGLYFSSSRRRRVMAWAWPSPCAIIPSPAFSTECPSKPRFLPRRQLADLIYPQPLSHAVSAVNLQQVCAGLCCRKPMQGRSNGCSLGSFAPQASRGTTQGLLRPPVPSARSWLMRVEMSPISAVPAAPLTGSTLMPSNVNGSLRRSVGGFTASGRRLSHSTANPPPAAPCGVGRFVSPCDCALVVVETARPLRAELAHEGGNVSHQRRPRSPAHRLHAHALQRRRRRPCPRFPAPLPHSTHNLSATAATPLPVRPLRTRVV
jgi:hypothetical protein